MNITEKPLVVGLCGRFCQGCQFFRKGCSGCVKENKELSKKCPIYLCARDKKVESCLQCPTTIPECRLLKGVAKNYCLVVALKRDRGDM